jgi:hypothetical protein
MTKEEMIQWIDNASYEDLLRKWRFADVANPFFCAEVGAHYKEVMFKRRDEVGPEAAVAASKSVGWDN